MHQCNYYSQKYTRTYNLKVHIEMMHSEDNINNQNNSTLPPLPVRPLLPPPPPPPTQEDYTYKMYNLAMPALPYSDSTLSSLALTPLFQPPPPISTPIKNQILSNIKKFK